MRTIAADDTDEYSVFYGKEQIDLLQDLLALGIVRRCMVGPFRGTDGELSFEI